MFPSLSKYVEDIKLPKFVKVKRVFNQKSIGSDSVEVALRERLELSGMLDRLEEGDSVCITCGSRGIANIDRITRTLVDLCKERGADPFIIPAMGSHGGATAEGQKEILKSLGVTEESMGCPVKSSMDTVVIGKTEDGMEVYADSFAAEADKIIPVNRIKPHTSFRGTYESGLMKMLAIGLGKQRGADACHSEGYKYMAQRIPSFGNICLEKLPIPFGIAIIENSLDETAEIYVVHGEEIPEREPELLKIAFEYLPMLPFDSCDVLIVDEIGKDISGGGMDPNISGAFSTPYASGGIDAQMRCILSLTEKTHGSAYGMGAADVISRRLYERIDFEKTYPNSITSTALSFSKMPLVMPNDRDAIALCIKSCTDIDREAPRIIRIKNSLRMDMFWISEAMMGEIDGMEDIEIIGEPEYLSLDKNGNLIEADG